MGKSPAHPPTWIAVLPTPQCPSPPFYAFACLAQCMSSLVEYGLLRASVLVTIVMLQITVKLSGLKQLPFYYVSRICELGIWTGFPENGLALLCDGQTSTGKA